MSILFQEYSLVVFFLRNFLETPMHILSDLSIPDFVIQLAHLSNSLGAF